MKSEVAQSCLTLWEPMDGSPPGSSIYGIFQTRVLEWVAVNFSIGKKAPPKFMKMCLESWLSNLPFPEGLSVYFLPFFLPIS